MTLLPRLMPYPPPWMTSTVVLPVRFSRGAGPGLFRADDGLRSAAGGDAAGHDRRLGRLRVVQIDQHAAFGDDPDALAGRGRIAAAEEQVVDIDFPEIQHGLAGDDGVAGDAGPPAAAVDAAGFGGAVGDAVGDVVEADVPVNRRISGRGRVGARAEEEVVGFAVLVRVDRHRDPGAFASALDADVSVAACIDHAVPAPPLPVTVSVMSPVTPAPVPSPPPKTM